MSELFPIPFVILSSKVCAVMAVGRRSRAFIEQHHAKPPILSAFSSRLDALVAQR
jgi:hypothetical protein